ncbi:GNAT family N-acetyltransferase [Trinickia acidisoli]|uniref:GNAT family N-acetyltransferase n=1 Tax=Trinickia acidisoli TaxID=2767482 RepID=UPI001A8C54BF|nr:GNAT family N-acetyltransferase [Trinickia acidisoli]
MPFEPFERFETERLLLRPLAPDDCQALFEQMLSDPETTRDLTWERYTDAWQTHEYITDAMAGWRYRTRFRYGLFGKDDGRLCAVIDLTPRLPRVELGVITSRQGGNRRRRDALAALRQVLDWLMEQPGVYRIFAYCAVDGRAYSVMERLGFTREGTIVNYEARPNRRVIAGDSYLYAMTRQAPPPEPIEDPVQDTRELLASFEASEATELD